MSDEEVMRKVLLVLTSNDKLGDTNEQTGWYLPEVAHPYYVFKEAGYDITFGSPLGGAAPCDKQSIDVSKDDEVSQKFLEDKTVMSLVGDTVPLSKINPGEYDAVFFAGGHGVMWDLPENNDVQRIVATIYEKNGVVSAVCHGPVAFLNVKRSDGSYLISGKRITAFTNEEEDQVNRRGAVPFTCEDICKERGAIFENGGVFKEQVSIDGRIVTGQNPPSAKPVAEAVCKILNSQKIALLVLTSNNKLGDTGKMTGWYLPEAVHPFEVLRSAGIAIMFASIKGGPAPCEESSIEMYKEDEECMKFLKGAYTKGLVENTVPISSTISKSFDIVFFVGGFGVMWDFPDNEHVQMLAKKTFESGGIVSGVCHGPIALVNVKLSNGQYLVDGKRVTAFTNEEEDVMKSREIVPFTCEDKLRERGAKFDKAEPFHCKVCSDGNIITGQNPQSARETAEKIVKALMN